MRNFFKRLTGVMLMLTCSMTALADTPQAPETGDATRSDALVVYFSNTGNTQAIAELFAEALGADLYRIEPEIPYTDADLDYNDDDSRANREMSDPSCRPAIAGEPLAAMDGYQTIYLGYPIWWGEAPRIISTFLESYDFGGKTIVPFCTSGSSGIGQSASHLAALTGETVNWAGGARFSADTALEDIEQWLRDNGHIRSEAQ